MVTWSRKSSTAANTATSTAWSIFRFGWGFSDQPGLQWRHRPDRVLRRVLDPGCMIRRWNADPFGFLRPWNELPALMWSAPPVTPPSAGSGVVTFLMGFSPSSGLCLSKLSRDRLAGRRVPCARSRSRLEDSRLKEGPPPTLNGRIDDFRIAQVQYSDACVATTLNNMSDTSAFAQWQRLRSKRRERRTATAWRHLCGGLPDGAGSNFGDLGSPSTVVQVAFSHRLAHTQRTARDFLAAGWVQAL